MPVSRSLAGDLLRDASSEYVSRLQRGASLIYWSIIAAVILSIVGFLAVIAVSFSGGAGGFNGPGLQILLSGVGFVVGLIGLYGWWLLSSPDPRYGPTQQGTARVVVRIAIAFRAAVSLLSLVVNIIMQGSVTGGGDNIECRFYGIGHCFAARLRRLDCGIHRSHDVPSGAGITDSGPRRV